MPEFNNGTTGFTEGTTTGDAFLNQWGVGIELDNQVTTARDAIIANEVNRINQRFIEERQRMRATAQERRVWETFNIDERRLGFAEIVDEFVGNMKPKGKDRSEKTFKLRL